MKNNVISLKQLVNETVNSLNEQPPVPVSPLTKKLPPSTPEQKKKQALARVIAKKIYNAKGVIYDKEYDAVKAIKEIPDAETFGYVQWELQKLTGGQGVGQYIVSFIDVKGANLRGGEVDSSSASGSVQTKTVDYLNAIITHLLKIKAPNKTIKFLQDYQMDVFGRGRANTHTYLEIINIAGGLLLGTFATPAAGAAWMAAIGAIDAKRYWEEGQAEMAGLVLLFSFLPGGAALGGTAAKKLAAKVLAKQTLTNSERALVAKAIAQRNAIKQNIRRSISDQVKKGNLTPGMVKAGSTVATGAKWFGAGQILQVAYVKLGGAKFARWWHANLNKPASAEEMNAFWKTITDRVVKKGLVTESAVSTRLTDILTETKYYQSRQLTEAPSDDQNSAWEYADTSKVMQDMEDDLKAGDHPEGNTYGGWGSWVLLVVGAYVYGLVRPNSVPAYLLTKPINWLFRGVGRWLKRKFSKKDLANPAIIEACTNDVQTLSNGLIARVRNGSLTAAEANAELQAAYLNQTLPGPVYEGLRRGGRRNPFQAALYEAERTALATRVEFMWNGQPTRLNLTGMTANEIVNVRQVIDFNPTFNQLNGLVTNPGMTYQEFIAL